MKCWKLLSQRKPIPLMKLIAFSMLQILVLALLGISVRMYQNNRDIQTRLAFVRKLGPGWNLGNSLDAHKTHKSSDDPAYYEVYWGNPPTTRKMLQRIQSQGFNSIRIPITWYEHMGEDGQIDEAWMKRVTQLVDWCMELGLYAIIDIQHDPWAVDLGESESYGSKTLEHLWVQIATHFADYDDHLLFENINEPRLVDQKGEWEEGSYSARQRINLYNELFVSTVRSIPGNENRFLLIPLYCNKVREKNLRDFVIPQDDYLIISVHAYTPNSFTISKNGTKYWSAEKDEDTIPILSELDTLYKTYLCEGIPIIITEFGAKDKNNTEVRATYTEYFVSQASVRGIPCMWWDNGNHSNGDPNDFCLYDRIHDKFLYPEIIRAISQGSCSLLTSRPPQVSLITLLR